MNTQRATGSYFKWKKDRPSAYWGETALDYAVATNQVDIVDILMGFEYIEGKEGNFDRMNETKEPKFK